MKPPCGGRRVSLRRVYPISSQSTPPRDADCCGAMILSMPARVSRPRFVHEPLERVSACETSHSPRDNRWALVLITPTACLPVVCQGSLFRLRPAAWAHQRFLVRVASERDTQRCDFPYWLRRTRHRDQSARRSLFPRSCCTGAPLPQQCTTDAIRLCSRSTCGDCAFSRL